MVSVVHSVAAQGDDPQFPRLLADGLDARESGRLATALDFARETYATANLGSGEGIWSHARGMALIIAGLKLDADSRVAALLFALPACDEHATENLEARFGADVTRLVRGMSGLNRLRPITHGFVAVDKSGGKNAQETRAQVEVLRKMLLAMVEDIRVVLLRLASRTQTLRHYAAHPDDLRIEVARETLELYSPLANRLGVWELKWELEDLSFRFLHPDTYKKIAKMLDETRLEREQFIAAAIERVKRELAELGIAAEVYGRPKHIYSIWNKMRKKNLEFTDVY
ncbi:MAG: HD domain-containing protein, partial [Zoogloeaceae bacterium]|nr:HD domain-containing protein [Zoogloeaceae bacterium]